MFSSSLLGYSRAVCMLTRVITLAEGFLGQVNCRSCLEPLGMSVKVGVSRLPLIHLSGCLEMKSRVVDSLACHGSCLLPCFSLWLSPVLPLNLPACVITPERD